MEIIDILLIAFGLITVLGVAFKPDIYWNRGRMRRMRSLLGDRATAVLYFVLGVLMLSAGLFFAFS